MKISIIITEGQKQVMMTPQTDHEKQCLKAIAPTDVLKVVSKRGQFDDDPRHMSENISMSKAGYLRRFPEAESLMFVIEPEEEKK